MTDALAGELTLHGRVMPASNATFVGEIDGLRVVYKPIAGERPLWDFPDGTLAGREVAAYLVSEALGWNIVPRTILRDGPHGPGMVQVWQEPDPAQGAGRPRAGRADARRASGTSSTGSTRATARCHSSTRTRRRCG